MRHALLVAIGSGLVLGPGSTHAASRQFNTFTAASDQAPAINPAVETLEHCPDCEPPTFAEWLQDRGCATCPKAKLPPPLQPDCDGCDGEDTRFTTAPFTTVTDTCADCEPFELSPRVGWSVDDDRAGSGVYLHDGSLFVRKMDIDIPGRGFSFRFVRRHVSSVTYDGPLGKNWDFTYNMRIVVDGAGDAWLHDGTGRADEFVKTGSSYVTPTGRFETLTSSGSPAKFHLTKPNGTDYAFDAATGNCKLATITDRAGNQMTLNYDGSARLATVTDTLSRTVTFAYDGNDRITTITDWGGRVWTFAYTSGELVSVTTPPVTGFASGKTTAYTYASGRLDTITDPRSNLVLDVTWDGSGRVDALRYGDAGDDFDFAYDSPSSGQVTVTDRVGNERVVTVDSNNQPTLVVEKTNRGVRSGEGDYTTDYTFGGDLNLTKVELPDGNEIGYTWTSGTRRLTKEEHADVAGTTKDEASWTYSSHGLVKTAVAPKASGGTSHTTTYWYDFEEATLGDLNGDGVTSGTDGVLVKRTLPTVTSQSPSITPTDRFRFNAHGQPTWWEKPDGELVTFTYHASGAQAGYLQKRIEDDNGTGSLKLTTEWTYTDVGNIATRKSPNGFTTVYTVNDLNQVTNETVPISSAIDYDIKHGYDANDNRTSMEVENLDEDGTAYSNLWITTTWTHETLNRVATRVDEIDATTTATTTYSHDENRNVTNVERPRGNETAFVHDERGLLYEVTRASGSASTTPAVERRSYTGNGLLATRAFKHVVGGQDLWNTTTWTYDEYDHLQTLEDALGDRDLYLRDAAGRATETKRKHRDAGSGDWITLTASTAHYNEAGWRWKRSEMIRKTPSDTPAYQDTTHEFRKDGQVKKVTDPRSLLTTCTFDTAGRRTVTEDDYGNKETLTLDGSGNVTKRELFDKAQAGSGSNVTRTTEYTYDRRDARLTQVVDPGSGHLALTTTWEYDSRGNPRTETDPRGSLKTFAYDGRNLVTSVTEALTGTTTTTTSYGYDLNGNLVSVEDDNGHETTFAFDDIDRRTLRTNPDTTTHAWAHDTEDRVTSTTDENGTVVANTFDAVGQVTHRDVTRATGVLGTEDEDYTWDAVGRLTEASNDDAVVTMAWDSLSRCYEESIEWLDAPSLTRTVERAFDANGNVTTLTYPNGSDIDVTVDADADRIDLVKSGSSTLADYRYVGPFIDKLDYLNGVVRTTTRDLAGRITQVQHVNGATTVAKFEYGLDANGNVLNVRRAHDANLYDVMTWDARNELDTVWYDATTSSSPSLYSKKVEHDWDGAFNLDQTVTTPYGQSATTTDYTASLRNEYTTIGSASPTWTENGELADDDTTFTFAYDWRGLLMSADDGTDTCTFQHDALGRRITTDFGTVLRFTWGGQQVLEEITGSTPTVNATWVYGMERQPVRMLRGSAASYYHGDADESIERLTGANGTVTESVSYEAWGKPSIASSSTGNSRLWHSGWFDFGIGAYGQRRLHDPAVLLRHAVARQGSEFGALPTMPVRTTKGAGVTGIVPVTGESPDPTDPCARAGRLAFLLGCDETQLLEGLRPNYKLWPLPPCPPGATVSPCVGIWWFGMDPITRPFPDNIACKDGSGFMQLWGPLYANADDRWEIWALCEPGDGGITIGLFKVGRILKRPSSGSQSGHL